MDTPKYQNAHKTSADMLRKYQDMILENQEEDEEQVEEGKLPPGLQAHIDAKNESKDEEVDESKDEDIDESKDEDIDESKDEDEVDESKDEEVDESVVKATVIPSTGALRSYQDMIKEMSTDEEVDESKDEEIEEAKDEDEDQDDKE